MRLKRNRLQPCKHRKAEVKSNNEGGKRTVYSEQAREIKAEVWPAGGKLQAEIYGQRLPYIFNCLMDLDSEIKEKDGFCIGKDEVTHTVESIKRYSDHQFLELELCRK